MTASCISISGRNKKHRKRENENRELITLDLPFAAIKDRGSALDLWTYYMQIMQHMTNHSPDILIVVRRTSEDLEGVSIQRIASSLP
jgi:hypothetical protein